MAAFLAWLGSLIPAIIGVVMKNLKPPAIVTESEKAGAAEQAAADAQAQANAERRVSEAQAQAAVTSAALVNELTTGNF